MDNRRDCSYGLFTCGMGLEKVGSIGRAVPNAELSLIDSEGNRIEGANTEGEMCYRGKM